MLLFSPQMWAGAPAKMVSKVDSALLDFYLEVKSCLV